MKTCASLLVHQRDDWNTVNYDKCYCLLGTSCLYFDRKCVYSQLGSIQSHFNQGKTFLGQRLNSLQGGDLYRIETPNPTSLHEQNRSDLTVFLNHNKNKEIKSPIILEYSLDKTTASKIKTLTILHVGKCKLFMNTAPYQFPAPDGSLSGWQQLKSPTKSCRHMSCV